MPNPNINRRVLIETIVETGAGDVELYSTNFSTGTPDVFPTGWTRFINGGSGNDAETWTSGLPTSMGYAISLSNGYAGASGGYGLLAPNNDGLGGEGNMTLSGQVSTVGYDNIRVSFGFASLDGAGFPAGLISLYFSWSSDGVTYTPTLITQSSADDTWEIRSFTLPAGAEGQANLRLRLEYNVSENAFFSDYAFDDFKVIGDEI